MTGERNNDMVVRRTMIWLIAITLACYFGTILYKGPWVDCDLLEGIFSLSNYLNGQGFHQVYGIDERYHMLPFFLSYWAPGQYVYSWGIASLLHTNIGNAIIITNVIFVSVGLYTYYRLLQHFRFSDTLIFTAIFMLVIQRFFNGLLLKMNGVDIYLIVFASATVLLYERYYAARTARKHALLLAALFLLLCAGLFSKNSFLLFVITCSAFYFIYYVVRYLRNMPGRPSLVKIALPAIVSLTAAVIFQVFIYGRGRTPFDERFNEAPLDLTALKLANIFIKPAVQTLGSGFTLDALLLHIPSTSKSYFSYLFDFSWEGIAGSILILIPLIYSIYRFCAAHKKALFPYLAVAAVCVYTLFFATAIVQRSDVYAEDRLFLPMLLLLMPVYAYTVLYEKRPVRYAMFIFVGISIAFSVLSVPVTFKYYGKSRYIKKEGLISGFLIHSETANFDELEQLGRLLSEKYPKNNLLITSSSTGFLLMQTELPCIVTDLTTRSDMDAMIDTNMAFLQKNGTSVLSVVKANSIPIRTGRYQVLEHIRLKDNELYVIATRKRDTVSQ
ncbi:hypothetical protein GCM10023093_16020 [Nemorincola caseinilytica]|uniref:Glycosyltransferase RgtA/B/C/D-like domain-containing protein n=1 Tax=Nemorincola caseinilytica TaxID=2054315 RepID=A0ABP8NF81_9BACT